MLKRTPNLDRVINSIDFYELRASLLELLDVLDGLPELDQDGSYIANYLPDALSRLTVAAAKDGFGSHPSVERFIPCKN